MMMQCLGGGLHARECDSAGHVVIDFGDPSCFVVSWTLKICLCATPVSRERETMLPLVE